MKVYGNIGNSHTYDTYDCQNNANKSSVMNIPGRNGRDIHNVLRNTAQKKRLRISLNKSTRHHYKIVDKKEIQYEY